MVHLDIAVGVRARRSKRKKSQTERPGAATQVMIVEDAVAEQKRGGSAAPRCPVERP